MHEVDEDVKHFIEVVKSSKTYLEYEKQKEIMKADPELKAKVDAYREENFNLQNAPDDGHGQERMEAFAEKYASFIEQPKVSAFLDAELNLCRMMQEVTDSIFDSLGFE